MVGHFLENKNSERVVASNNSFSRYGSYVKNTESNPEKSNRYEV